MGGLADADSVGLEPGPDPRLGPQLVLDALSGPTLDGIDGDAGGHVRVKRRQDADARNGLQSRAQHIAEFPDPGVDSFRSDPEMELEGGLTTEKKRQVTGSSLAESESGIFAVVPLRGGQGRPYIRHAVFFYVKESRPCGSQQPLVKTAVIGVAIQVPDIDRDVAHGLGAVDDGEKAAAAGFGAELADGKNRAASGYDVRHGQHAGARGHGFDEQIQNLFRISSGFRNGDFPADDAAALFEEAPAADAAGVFLVRKENFVSGFEIETESRRIHARRGIFRESDLFGKGVDEPADSGTDFHVGLVTGDPIGVLVIPISDALGGQAQVADHGVENDPGHSAERSRIKEGRIRSQGKQTSDLVPKFGIVRFREAGPGVCGGARGGRGYGNGCGRLGQGLQKIPAGHGGVTPTRSCPGVSR